MKRSLYALTAAVALTLAAPGTAHADVDTDFANTLHTYGIYGQRDFNAWIAKLACKRLHTGVDGDAYASQHFVSNQLDRHSSDAHRPGGVHLLPRSAARAAARLGRSGFRRAVQPGVRPWPVIA